MKTPKELQRSLRSCLREVRQYPPCAERDEAYVHLSQAIVWVKELGRAN